MTEPSTVSELLFRLRDVTDRGVVTELDGDLHRWSWAEHTFKVLTRALADEGLLCADPVWERHGSRYRRL
ncbi:MAG: hypothetical protein ICV72_05070 [Aldersonia sp.]|nr:hypothetical protein [Aldersonia sp.]